MVLVVTKDAPAVDETVKGVLAFFLYDSTYGQANADP